MKIYVTLDCIKLTDFEKLLLVVIKGVLYDFYRNLPEQYQNERKEYIITVKPCDIGGGLTAFKIEGNTPAGLFDEVKRLITPFSCGFQMQGGFYKEDKSTSIILQRFEMKRKTLNYFEANGLTNN